MGFLEFFLVVGDLIAQAGVLDCIQRSGEAEWHKQTSLCPLPAGGHKVTH